MPESYTVTSLSQLTALIAKHARQKDNAVRKATQRAARKGRPIVKKNVPVAHGELRESVASEDCFIIVDAPHAAAVNNGSRPHYPPLEPLIAWVKLRGMQGLMTDRQLGRLPGNGRGELSTSVVARTVAGHLAALQHRGPAGYSPTDSAIQVARAIQHAIGARGTKAHHFMEKSLPALRELLGQELRDALFGKPASGPDTPGPSSPPKPPDTRRRDTRGRFI